MARLNEDGQWIVMMGFIVSITILILAIVVAESSLVGKTTSESVLEFSKSDIQDLRSELLTLNERDVLKVQDELRNVTEDIQNLSLERKSTIVEINSWRDPIARTDYISIHFNNGITNYNEVYDEYY